MADSYLSFLRSPTASALAPDASLHYITSTTSIHGATAIIKHFQAQEKVIKKKAETVLSSLSCSDGAVVETETTFEFVRGGGAILPQMDDNMLADSLATVPMVHVVQLDGQGKISQIRLYWDQSTMLKQVDAIGKSGRNWPIREGEAQVKTVKQSINAASPASTSLPSRSANANDVIISDRTKTRMADRDFHNTRLFATGDGQERSSNPSGPSVATRTSAKPTQRHPDELFTTEAKGSPQAEGKFKLGAGKNFGDNRLFDENKAGVRDLSPERKRIHAQKYGHFEFANGENADSPRPASSNAKKHMSNWDFADFVTPEKVKQRPNPEQDRHIGPGVDEDEPPSPAKRPIVHAPRPDANAHFTITDESSPANGNNKAALSNTTNVDRSRRDHENDTHFSAKGSPSHAENAGAIHKARGSMEPHYHMGDTDMPRKIYKTAGNGIGGRKGAPSLWDDPEPVKEQAIYKTAGNGMGGRRDGGLSWSIGDEDEDDVKAPAIYKTAGDGMGGLRRDATRSARDMNQPAQAGADELEF